MSEPYDRDSRDEISIIAEGGGMRSAYVLGVLDAIYHEYGLTEVDYLAGSSSAAPTLAYYGAEQMEVGERIWMEKTTDPEFSKLTNLVWDKPLFDIDYLIEDVLGAGEDLLMEGDSALDIEAIEESDTEFIIPVTRCDDGSADYFSSASYDSFYDEILDLFKATMAEPFTYKKEIEIDGDMYFDGFFSSPIPINAPEVEDTEKIVIMTQSEEEQGEECHAFQEYLVDWIEERSVRDAKEGIQTAVESLGETYKETLDQLKEEHDRSVIIQPSEPVSKIDNSIENVYRTMNQGYQDAMENEALQEFIERHTQ